MINQEKTAINNIKLSTNTSSISSNNSINNNNNNAANLRTSNPNRSSLTIGNNANYSALYSMNRPSALSVPASYAYTHSNSNPQLVPSSPNILNPINSIEYPIQQPYNLAYNKYAHLAQYQHQQQMLANKQVFLNGSLLNAQNRPQSPTAFLINNQHQLLPNASSSTSALSSLQYANKNLINIPLSLSTTSLSTANNSNGVNLFPPSEQEQLDDGFLNLLNPSKPNSLAPPPNYNKRLSLNPLDTVKIDNTRKLSMIPLSSSGSLLRQASSKPGKKSKEKNLIDLETTLDIKELSVMDLFDPLAERQPKKELVESEEEIEDEDVDSAAPAPPTAPAPKPPLNTQSSVSTPTENVKPKFKPNDNNKENYQQKRRCEVYKRKKKKGTLSKSNSSSLPNISSNNLSNKYSNRIEHIKLVDQPPNNIEFENFSKTINDLKHKCDIEQKELSHLIVFSSILDCPISNRHDVRMVIRYNNNTGNQTLNDNNNNVSLNESNQNKRSQITISTSINATVETLVYNVLSLFNIDELNPHKYLLKIHGLEEYLPIAATLAELKYIHDCLIENKDPVLVLIELKNVNTELTNVNKEEKSPADEKKPSTENIFKIEKQGVNKNFITKAKLDNLLKAIIQNRNSLEEAIEDKTPSSSYMLSYSSQLDTVLNRLLGFKEKIKCLVKLIFDIHFDSIQKIIDGLEFNEKSLEQYQKGRNLKERQQLIQSDDYGGNSGSDSNIQLIYNNLIDLINDALYYVCTYINCASYSFYWLFKAMPVFANNDSNNNNNSELDNEDDIEQIEILQANEKPIIYFNSLSRLGSFFNGLASTANPTIELYIRFSIMYGTKCLDSVIVKLDRLERFLNKKVDFFVKPHKIQFDRIEICVLPRESVLLIQICSSNATNPINTTSPSDFSTYSSSNPVINVSSKYNLLTDDIIDKYHAWTAQSLFDEEMVLRSGDQLLCLFVGETPNICTTASNIHSNKDPVIQLCYMNEDYIYVFPNSVNECECVTKDFQKLPIDKKELLLDICNKNVIATKLTDEDKDIIYANYLYLNGIPNALAKIYLSFPSYDYSSMIHFYAFLKQFDPLSLAESLELLLPYFPEVELRNHAVRSLEMHSAETISLYLPQLLEALKYERTHNSALLCMLLNFASKSIRFAHKLFWQLREFRSRSNECLKLRYNLLFHALNHFFTQPMIEEIHQEEFLVDRIDQITTRIKETKDNAEKLYEELEYLHNEWPLFKNNQGSCRLPYNISYCTKEIDIKSCSLISSFTMPVKLVFKNIDPTANSFYTIYKIGDDLRQDMFVLQLINVMNQLWIMEDHDLNVLTFTCLQTGNRRGFIEMITNAETLKEIQKGVVLNAFKKSCINDWLRTHNPNINNFRKAVENFTKSCAAYSVATYILGIGDRHNDNIMIKYTGHMFHIDFGKYLGDAQTFAGFKRDRTPILFTSDMFYVINQGKELNARFQEFIEMCCRAFQILRKNHHHLLSLIELMTSSGIPGLNQNAIQYVYKNLMIDLNEDDASNAFKKLIHDSLSKFASFNFAIHTLAQPKTVNSSNYFSFLTYTYNAETDGKILGITLERNTKPMLNTVEMFKCLVTRENEYDTNEVFRTFDEFCELYALLMKTFPALRLPETPSLAKFKETKQSFKRRQIVESLINDLVSLQSEISQSDIIYTFFHSILRDQKQENTNTIDYTISSKEDPSLTNKMIPDFNLDINDFETKGQIKIKLKYKDNRFFVNCLQCRNLKPPNSQPVSSLKPYVKCYLRPDAAKATKKKVQALFNGANPIFTETMEYDILLNDLKNRILEVSVLNNKINNKERIGVVEIRLFDIDWSSEYIKWYDLR